MILGEKNLGNKYDASVVASIGITIHCQKLAFLIGNLAMPCFLVIVLLFFDFQ